MNEEEGVSFIRLKGDRLAMLYHYALYDRMTKFAKEHTPEFSCDAVVKKWLDRLYLDDDSLHIVVDINENGDIQGHAVLDVQEAFGNRILTCYQLSSDVRVSKSHIDEAMEYIDKLCSEIDASCTMIIVEKNANVYKKKYGFNRVREVLIKWK